MTDDSKKDSPTFEPILQMRNRVIETDLRQSSGVSLSNISNEVLEKVRQILARGMMLGQNPCDIALDLVGRIDTNTKMRVGGVITLSNSELADIDKVTNWLNQLDENYLSLELRDKRFDRTVKKAISARKFLQKEQVSRIVQTYADRVLLNRGELIAQTEIMTSINRSEYVAHLKMVEEGSITKEAITKEWDDCGDRRVRASHAEMAVKYGKGKGIPLDEPFILPSGSKLLHPGDLSLGAPFEEIVGCRCRVSYQVDWLSRAE